MKKIFILAAFAAMAPLSMMAQDDDLYFNPKQEAKQLAAECEKMDREIAANYSGSQRSVDEYNRNGKFISRFKKIGTDSLGNDIITFRVGRGVKPDSIYDDAAFVQKYLEKGDDYECTRNMSRWDGYYDPWLYDYYGMGPYYWRSAYWGWRNPWRYGYYAGWYDPFYDPWFDPWYYGYAGWYGGWYDPWYYGWGGYYRPYYWGGPVYAHVVRPGGGYAGHRSWGGPTGPGNGNAGRFNGGRYNAQSGARQNGNQFGNMTRRNVENRNASTFQRSGSYMNNSNRSFGSGSSFGGGSRSGGFSGGGSFGGGVRSGGGGFTGGGHFGGGRR